jgi:Domain of unknown function (DUF4340)
MVAPRGQFPGGRMSPQALKRIALALVVALVVWGGLALLGKTHRDDSGGLMLPHIAVGDVSEISFRKASDTVVLIRQGEKWAVNGFPAATKTVQTFVGALGDSSARSELVAQSAASHKRLGVDSTTGRRITISAGGKPALDLWFGNRGPDFEGFYVRLEGSNTVYLLRGRFAEQTVQGVPEWRDKEIAAVPADSVRKVEVATGGKKWSLTRSGANWNLPSGPADSTKVARYLLQFGSLRAAGFPEAQELDSIHFEKPDRTLTLRSASGKSLLALVFDSTHAGSFWVRGADGGPVYRMDGRTAQLATPAESTLKK